MSTDRRYGVVDHRAGTVGARRIARARKGWRTMREVTDRARLAAQKMAHHLGGYWGLYIESKRPSEPQER